MRQRLCQLDGIRGLAALVVVLHHYVTALPEDQHAAWGWLFRFPPLRLLVAGHAAVIIFFVLSGCVLSLAYRGAEPPSTQMFITKRIVRLYPTYAAALLLALALHYAAVRWGTGAWSGALASFWKNTPAHADYAGAFLLSGTTSAIDIDSPSWSLVHEMRLAFILPLLIQLTIAGPGRALALGAGVSLVITCSLPLIGLHDRVLIGAETIFPSILISLYYAVFFALGAWLPSVFGQGMDAITGSRLRRVLVLLAALVLLQLPQSLAFVDVAFGIAAAALIGLGLGGYLGVLEIAPVQAVGQRSFSLYLVHFPALQLTYVLLDPHRPLLFLAAYLGLTVALTLLLYEVVERPFAHLCSKIRPSSRAARYSVRLVPRSSRDI